MQKDIPTVLSRQPCNLIIYTLLWRFAWDETKTQLVLSYRVFEQLRLLNDIAIKPIGLLQARRDDFYYYSHSSYNTATTCFFRCGCSIPSV
jgi:hypothetical protein